MKKIILFALTAIACFGSGQLIYFNLANVIYLGEMQMKEEFWQSREKFIATLDSPIIPIQIPGPMDSWAGSQPKEISMQVPYTRSSAITINFLDSHESSPTKLAVLVNGSLLDSTTVKAGSGKTHPLWWKVGIKSSYTAMIPGSLLKQGKATVTLRSIGGSWSAIDRVVIKQVSNKLVTVLTVVCWLTVFVWTILYVTKEQLWKNVGINVALTVCATIIYLLALEAIIRTTFPQREFIPRLRIVYQPESEIGFMLKPNVVTGLGFNTNDYGLRDYNHYKMRKPPNVYRVLAVGDSQTFSVTSMENSYPKLMERLLSKSKVKVEVINAGIPGYGPDEEYFYLKKYGLAFNPDLVTVGISVSNDITDSLHHPVNTAVDGALVSIKEARSMTKREMSRKKKRLMFLNQFHLYRFLSSRNYKSIIQAQESNSRIARKKMSKVSTKCVKTVGGDLHKNPENHNKTWRAAFNKTVVWLVKFQELSKERGFDLIIVLIPSPVQMDNQEAKNLQMTLQGDYQWNEPQQSLASELKKAGLNVYNALSTMKNQGKNKALYYCGDTHLNEQGNLVLADGINKWILGSGIAPYGVRNDKIEVVAK